MRWAQCGDSDEIVESLRRFDIVARSHESAGCVMTTVVLGEADRAQAVYLHEREEDKTGDELLSDDEVDDRAQRPD